MPRTRLLIPLALVLGACAVPASAGAAFQSHVRPDHVSIVGTDEPETLVVRASGQLLAHSLTTPGFASELDFDTSLPGTQTVPAASTTLIVDAEGGDDQVHLDAPGARLFADGGEGGDRLTGSDRRDRLMGGPGDDVARGGGDIDAAFLGEGDDRYEWLGPAHDSDSIDGGGGVDRVFVAGTPVDDTFRAASNGQLVRLTLDSAGAVRFGAVERLAISPGEGDDVVAAGELPRHVSLAASGASGVDLVAGGAGDDVLSAETMDGGAGDDRMTVATASGPVSTDGGAGMDATHVVAGAAADALTLQPAGPAVEIDGLPIAVFARGEALAVEGGGGDDNLTVESGAGTYAAILFAGGAGDDVLRGSEAIETLDGGAGFDVVDGGRGPDRLLGGSQDDVIRARDNAADDVACGDGGDVVLMDGGTLDTLAACEHAEPGAATTPAGLARVFGTSGLELDSGVVDVPVACSAGARGGCHGALDLVTEPLATGEGPPLPALLGVAAVSIAPGATATVAVPVGQADSLMRAQAGLERPLEVWAQLRTTTGEHATRLPLDIRR